MVKILDCTTRDSGYSMNWEFKDEEIFELINLLQKYNVDYYEIGYRNFYDIQGKGEFYRCMPKFLEKFRTAAGSDLKIGVMADVKRLNPTDFQDAKDDFADFVRLACHPDEISSALGFTDLFTARGYKVFVHLMDVSNITETGFIELYNYQNKDTLESLYFADSYGTITPIEVEHYYNKFKMLGYERISFHAHNKRKLALKNTQKAIKLGAYSVDISQINGGRNGGNLAASELFSTDLGC